MPWSRGNGKSWFERFEGIHLSVAENFGILRKDALDPFRGIRIIGLCPTLKQFRDIHGAALESELTGHWKQLGGKLNRSTLRIEWPDGSWFQPMPAQTASSKAARGQRCDIILMDECDDIPKEVVASVVRPWFTEPWSLRKILAGGTPRMGRNGLLWQYHSRGISEHPKDARYLSKIATWRDAPELIAQSEVDDAREDTDPAIFAREWECDFDSGGGLVFPTFDESFHIQEPPSGARFNRYVLGIDHGWEHPGAFILIGVTGYGNDKVCWVLEEEVASHRENEKWDEIASEKYNGMIAFADPSRPDRIASLRRAGLHVQPADNSHEAGIQAIANLMFIRGEDTAEDGTGDVKRWSRFYIHPKCQKTIAELKNYRRKPDPLQPGKFLDDVVKTGDDCCDALRYAIISEFGRPANRKHEVRGS
jgi:phage terminase large subunit